jgi:deoxyribodipyrimidine photolyase
MRDTLVVVRNPSRSIDNESNLDSVVFFIDDLYAKSDRVRDFLRSEFESIAVNLDKPYSIVESREELRKLLRADRNVVLSSFEGHYESKLFKDLEAKRFSPQSLLFDEIDKEAVASSFTTFRKWAEPRLPDRFENCSQLVSQRCKEHLNFYFSSDFPAKYFETRNHLDSDFHSTWLSPYLAVGSVDVRRVYNAVKQYEKAVVANKSTYWIVFELLWREYFHWHYHYNQRDYFSENGLHGQLDFYTPSMTNAEVQEKCKDHLFMRACFNQLTETGFLSNRSRQIFASEWIHTLSLHWLEGAKFFEHELLDYNPASNYGNWMYIAGVGVDPRGGRAFNLEKQLKNYDPQGQYIRKWS